MAISRDTRNFTIQFFPSWGSPKPSLDFKTTRLVERPAFPIEYEDLPVCVNWMAVLPFWFPTRQGKPKWSSLTNLMRVGGEVIVEMFCDAMMFFS
jgi:hypothetical protein